MDVVDELEVDVDEVLVELCEVVVEVDVARGGVPVLHDPGAQPSPGAGESSQFQVPYNQCSR